MEWPRYCALESKCIYILVAVPWRDVADLVVCFSDRNLFFCVIFFLPVLGFAVYNVLGLSEMALNVTLMQTG